MRRWNLTVGLIIAAGVAALAAPRLVGVVVDALPDRSSAVVAIPPAPVVPVIPEALPLATPVRAGESLIPELANPVRPGPIAVVPVDPIPEPELDPFWDGCPACGMG